MSKGPRHDRHDLQRIAHRALIEKGFLPDFSAEVAREVDALSPELPAPARRDDVRDLTGLLWCSIDNDDSRDLDQLTVAEALPDGSIRVLVAIADVAARVAKGSAIDRHAATNTTSVYTGAIVFPMLPTRLSTDLTSLNEGEERLAMVVEMVVGPDGAVGKGEVYRARVHNKAQLTYDNVAAWWEKTAPLAKHVPGLEANLELQMRAAAALKRHRHENGALDLEGLETRPVFQGDVMSDLRVESKNCAKALIEDFMIGANGVTARFLSAKKVTSIRRVVRSPDRWARIVKVAEDLGESLPETPDVRALETFLDRRREADPKRFPDLSLVVVKLMGSGEYVVDRPGQPPIGHFGLAVRDYTHSTAPNRRYPDLVTQRLLQCAIGGGTCPYTDAELEALVAHCADQESDASKIERQVKKSAAALLLEGRVGEIFEGIITGASSKGTWLRIYRPAVEGKLIEGAEGLDVGAEVRVKLVGTHFEKGFIDFVRVR